MYLILFFINISAKANNSTHKLTSSAELVEGVIAIVDGDVITIRDLNVELIIENKIKKGEINIDYVLNRLIEDKLIYQQLLRYYTVFGKKEFQLEKEYESLKNVYGDEKTLRDITFLLGTNLATVYEKLREKKMIYDYLNLVVYESISYNLDEIKDYYINKSGSMNYDESQFYLNLNNVRDEFIKQKSEEVYNDYINKLKENALIEIDKYMVDFLKREYERRSSSDKNM